MMCDVVPVKANPGLYWQVSPYNIREAGINKWIKVTPESEPATNLNIFDPPDSLP
jgi:hypothetical protein